jgi:phage repressor protein C with HTH and peptisase S24 domain
MERSKIAAEVERRMIVRGMSCKSLSAAAGLNETYVRDLLKGRSKNPQTTQLAKLATALGCTIGDLSNPKPPSFNQPEAEKILPFSIPELDVRAMGGAGAESPDLDGNGQHPVVATWAIPADFLRAHTPSPDDVRIIRVVGDSMEPEYPAGDRVLMDTSHRTPSPPGVYVVWDGFALILKRLEIVLGSAPATVRLSSSNPAYPPYERPIEDLRVQGRVMGKWVWK